jgi:hypothetical protein
MQRGLRSLAVRGVSARPTALRPAYFTTGGAVNPRIMLARDRA